MANIMPFRATRYNLPKAGGDLNQLISMPYDRIKHELQDAYYARSEFNICRVIKGKEFPTDGAEDNVYTRSGETWRKWMAAGIVRQDNDPALYAYYQTFDVDGQTFTRRGFCAMVELEDYSSGKVKAHERTLDAPKQDRFKLLLTTDTHFGQIFQLYPDDDNAVAELIAQHTQRPPDMEGRIPEEDALHQVWAITDPAAIAAVQEAMRERLLFIADGHHRYETAINYRNHRLAEYNGGEGGRNPRFAMMTMVGMSDPGLVVLPTLRILHHVPDWSIAKMLDALARYFTVSAEDTIEAMQAKLDAAAQAGGRNAYGLYADGKYWYFELNDRAIIDQLAPEHSADWRSLDVAVLHEVVLEHLLGITKEAQAAKTNLSYERDRWRAKGLVDDGSHQCLIFMNPTKMEQIRNVAGKGEVMPQKSTDFFPKLLDGFCACQVDLGQKKG